MSEQVPTTGSMSDDDTLAFARNLRVKIIGQLMPGAEVPGDNSDRIMLGQMLSGLESVAIGSKRIQADQKNADNTAAVVAELLRTMDKNSLFQTQPTDGSNRIIDVPMREVPSSITDIPALPGEMDVAPPQLDYASFVRSQGKDVDQIGKEVVHSESNSEWEDLS